jgi:hypothetical protein
MKIETVKEETLSLTPREGTCVVCGVIFGDLIKFAEYFKYRLVESVYNHWDGTQIKYYFASGVIPGRELKTIRETHTDPRHVGEVSRVTYIRLAENGRGGDWANIPPFGAVMLLQPLPKFTFIGNSSRIAARNGFSLGAGVSYLLVNCELTVFKG